MGVEYYLVCNDCKEYIDLHKAYMFSIITSNPRPLTGDDKYDSTYNLCTLNGNYWETRGLWFLWNHRGHKTEMENDSNDNWFDKEPYLKEVFPHHEDLKIRGE